MLINICHRNFKRPPQSVTIPRLEDMEGYAEADEETRINMAYDLAEQLATSLMRGPRF